MALRILNVVSTLRTTYIPAGLDRLRARASRRRAATGLRRLLRNPHAQDGIHAQMAHNGRVPAK